MTRIEFLNKMIIKRRKLLKATLAAAPVVLTLRSGMASARTSLNCSEDESNWVEPSSTKQYWEDGALPNIQRPDGKVLVQSCYASMNLLMR